mmetsp:Transcript_12855/g.30062  ORF Transcript_12855/g.30062 Transcript_12855/m.30062 type:complete len:237 (+) Transcript_12855:214-924(+)
MELEAGSIGSMYQISYSEESVGRIWKSSKIRTTWEFLGNNGRRHKIILAWSKATGKQTLLMDGTEVWFGRNKGRSVLDHNWTTQDESLKLHVLASCAPPMNATFRNFDLVINGQLFVDLPQYDTRSEGSTYLAPILPPTGNISHNSIIQVLYPKGYVPPMDKDQQQHQRETERRRQEPRSINVDLGHGNGTRSSATNTTQNLNHNIPTAVNAIPPSLASSTPRNGGSHQPMVDLLM